MTLIDRIAALNATLTEFSTSQRQAFDLAAQQCCSTLEKSGKLLVAGNGGSFSQAQHFCAELVVRLHPDTNRPPLPALALMSDAASLTACANDFEYDQIFSRSIRAFASQHDMVILLSTSGRSPSILEAARFCAQQNIATIAIVGNNTAELSHCVDHMLAVSTSNTAIIQEAHMFILHELAFAIERDLYFR